MGPPDDPARRQALGFRRLADRFDRQQGSLYGDAVQAEKLGGTGFPPADAKADSDKKTFAAQIAAGHQAERSVQCEDRRSGLWLWLFSDAENLGACGQDQGRRRRSTEPECWVACAGSPASMPTRPRPSLASPVQCANARVIGCGPISSSPRRNPAPALPPRSNGV